MNYYNIWINRQFVGTIRAETISDAGMFVSAEHPNETIRIEPEMRCD